MATSTRSLRSIIFQFVEILVGILLTLPSAIAQSGSQSQKTLEATNESLWGAQFSVQKGTDSGFNDVLFHPSGKSILTVGNGFSVLWDLDSGREIREIGSNEHYATSAAFSPDGSWLVTAAGGMDETDAVVRVWNVATGKEHHKLIGHTLAVTAVTFTSDSKQILTGSRDKTIRTWDALTGRELSRVTISRDTRENYSQYDDVNYISQSPDKKRIFYCSFSSTAREISARTSEVLLKLDRPGKEIHDCAVSPDWSLAAIGAGFEVQTVNMRNGQTRATLQHQGMIHGIGFSANGKKVVTGSEDSHIRVWDSDNGALIAQFIVPAETIQSAAISGDGKTVASSGHFFPVAPTSFTAAEARLWNVVSGKQIRSFNGLADNPGDVQAGDGGLIFFSGSDRIVTEWDSRTGAALERYRQASNPNYSRYQGQKFGGLLMFPRDSNARPSNIPPSPVLSKLNNIINMEGRFAGSSNGQLFAMIDDNNKVVARNGGNRTLWRSSAPFNVTDLSISSADKYIALTYAQDGAASRVRILRVADGEQIIDTVGDKGSVRFSPIDDTVLIMTWSEIQLWQLSSRKLLKRWRSRVSSSSTLPNTSFSRDGKTLAIGGGILNDIEICRISKTATCRKLGSDVSYINRLLLSSDGQNLIVREDGCEVWNLDVYKRWLKIPDCGFAQQFSKNSDLLVSPYGDDAFQVWNTRLRALVHSYTTPEEVWSTDFIDEETMIVTSSRSGNLRIWERNTGLEVAKLASTQSGGWAAVAPDGRFDGSVDDLEGFNWIATDAPFQPLPIEIFLRDYYEPNLVGRRKSCIQQQAKQPEACEKSFAPIRSLASLNRVQPTVRIIGVMQGPKPDEALVEVEVSQHEDSSQPNGKIRTAPYDLRLYRDGQLVGRLPEGTEGSDEIVEWRQRTLIALPADQSSLKYGFVVRLPTGARTDAFVFTAYAFNEDRVKSATARDESYYLPKNVVRRQPKAYVLSIGVNGYEDRSRELKFAVRDAEATSQALSSLEGYEVVRITLTSEVDPKTWQATKANIREMLTRLSGKPANPSALADVLGADNLAQVTPDDLVILSFSGHGHTDPDGAFYLLPSDSGLGSDIDRTRFISSEELTAWLGPIDAGQMAMIIDACHSAASIEQPGFKPGPMGDRGLGQLAYDKAMRILAASQAGDVALESEKLQQGLLTYALVRDGLSVDHDDHRLADFNRNGVLTLDEWLKYGEQRTPALYEDIRENRIIPHNVGKDAVIDPRFQQTIVRRVQTPILFDFERRNVGTVILGMGLPLRTK